MYPDTESETAADYYNSANFGSLFNAYATGTFGPADKRYKKQQGGSCRLGAINVQTGGFCNIANCTFNFFHIRSMDYI